MALDSTIHIAADVIRALIEKEAKEADNFANERKRLNEESIYLNDELDRLIRTEELIEKRHRNETLRQDRIARKDYANKTFILTCAWATVIFLIIFSIGTKKFAVFTNIEFILSDKVLITLITSTTVNFFGFFLLVMKYLFHTEVEKKQPIERKPTVRRARKPKQETAEAGPE